MLQHRLGRTPDRAVRRVVQNLYALERRPEPLRIAVYHGSGSGPRGLHVRAAEDRADAAAFARRGLNDRHHFRFVVTPEDASEMTDHRAFTR